MHQRLIMSLAETVRDGVVGYGLAVGVQVLLFPLFGLRAALRWNLAIGAHLTLVSLIGS